MGVQKFPDPNYWIEQRILFLFVECDRDGIIVDIFGLLVAIKFMGEIIFIFTNLFVVLVDLLSKTERLYDTSTLICLIILILSAITN